MVQNSLTGLLNRLLAQAVDLKLQAKQAHWNVKGSNFIALHELFDNVATEADGYADMIAERVVQLGAIAEGTLQLVTRASTLKSYPADIKCGDMHIKALSDAIKTCADNVREGIDTAATAGDAVTADLLTEVARGFDKSYWFVSAHIVPKA